jgi:hypothetical protein
MAKKMNNLRLEQMNWAQSEITNRKPTTEPAALYLMQIRSSKLRISPLKKRVPIFVDSETRADLPRPVKIRHGA